jgi:hypothetical protein
MSESETIIYPKAKRKTTEAPAPAQKRVDAPAVDPVQQTTPEPTQAPQAPVMSSEGEDEKKLEQVSRLECFADDIFREADECGAALDAVLMLIVKYATEPDQLMCLRAIEEKAIARLRDRINQADEPLTLQEAKIVGGLQWLSGKLNPGRSEICDEICNLIRDSNGGVQ